ncbi:MAG: PKD domain-containing protein, partial [Anaerolineales bacterium]|nr:PKD domain-containing protein [Anaerolineales bacterium]
MTVLSLGSTPRARAATVTLIQKATVHNLTTNSVVIQWATKENGNSQVTYGAGNYGQTATAVSSHITSSDSAPYNDYYLYEATLTGLNATTVYQYKIFTDGVELGASTVRSARSNSQTSFRFAAFGDSGAASDGQRGVAARLIQVQPDFILHAGDMVYSVASYKDLHLKHFDIYEELLDNIWLAPSVGNHDYDYNSGRSIADSFANPFNGSSNTIEREMYYSFDYGNAHFTVMTSEFPSSNGSAQYNWARDDLAATNKFWKIVVFHEPPYYGTSAAYGNLVSLFEQQGVDIVISGDRHFYERLKPLKGGQVTTIDDGGIFYVVTGGGGTGLGSIGSPPWPTRTAERARLFHFVMFDVNDCNIEFSAVERTYSDTDTFDSGDIFDTFTINKCSGNVAPSASFSGTPTSGTGPLSVSFTDESSGQPTSWQWDFGDGYDSTERNPTHLYATPGTYDVSLTVSNSFGSDTATHSRYITVFIPPSPTADFSATPLTGLNPLTVQFSDESSHAGTWLWDFGDGNSSTEQNPSHIYTTAGTYDVSLTVTNSQGDDTRTRTDYVTVTNPPAPTAAFTSDTQAGTSPLTVQFTDQSTNSPTSWAWDFGDGNSSTERNPSHIYNTIGSYTVSLTAGNATGSDDEVKTDFIVVTNGPKLFTATDDAHTKSSSPTNNYGRDSQMRTRSGSPEYASYVKFNVTDLGGTVVQAILRLYVNDGSDDSGTAVLTATNWDENSITYSNAPALDGTVVSQLGATSNNGWIEVDVTNFVTGEGEWSFGIRPNSSNSTYFSTKEGSNAPELQIIVSEGPPPAPVAAFTADTTSGNAPLTVQFTDQSTNNPTSWAWDFGDGNNSTERSPSHIYTTAGTYTVSLTASNGSGSDDEVKTNYITVTVPPAPACAGTGLNSSRTATLRVQCA